MGRYLAGVASALLLVTIGFLVWKGRADGGSAPDPAPPAAVASGTPTEEASAVPEPPSADKSREEKRFARYDGDENGIITRAEMMETRKKPFQKLDKDGNGTLSFEEWAVTTADKFARADSNRDGHLTRAEFATTKRVVKAKKCVCQSNNGAGDE